MLFYTKCLIIPRHIYIFVENFTVMITATQSLKLYELLNKNFKNAEDAREMVTQIELVIENRFQAERDRLATKEDLAKLETRIVLWIVGFNTILAGLIIAAFKLL